MIWYMYFWHIASKWHRMGHNTFSWEPYLLLCFFKRGVWLLLFFYFTAEPSENSALTFSQSGTSSSSKRSRGSFPTKISLPLSGGDPSQPGGGPPYLLWPFSYQSIPEREREREREEEDGNKTERTDIVTIILVESKVCGYVYCLSSGSKWFCESTMWISKSLSSVMTTWIHL